MRPPQWSTHTQATPTATSLRALTGGTATSTATTAISPAAAWATVSSSISSLVTSSSAAGGTGWLALPSGSTVSNCSLATDDSGAVHIFGNVHHRNPAESLAALMLSGEPLEVPRGWASDIRLPDGSVLRNTGGDNFTVEDRDARVVYRGCREREFNRFLNASDLAGAFLDFLGARGVPQHRLLDVPLTVFLHFLIREAALADGEEPPPEVAVDDHPALLPFRRRRLDRCGWCGRFLARAGVARGLLFCTAEHFALASSRSDAAS